MLWITLKAGDLSHKLDFWHTGSLPTCLKENLKYLCFPSLHIWSWWQLRAFKTNMYTSEMYKRNFLVKVLFITHEGVWQFRGQTQERNTGSLSVWIKILRITYLHWSVPRYRTFPSRNLVCLADLGNFCVLVSKGLVNLYARRNIFKAIVF